MDYKVKVFEIKTTAVIVDTSTLQQQVAQVQKQQEKMGELLDDYEGRARRNNIRILGVPERLEEPSVNLFIEDLILKTLQPKRLSSYFSI